MPMYNCVIYIFLSLAVLLSITSKKLTIAGGITGGVIALLIFKGAGYTGIIMLALFFIAGTVATGWKAVKKQNLGIAERDKGRRTAGQVIANGGIAVILGAVAWLYPQYATFLQLAIAGSLASAIADTLSSELGSVYGSRFYDIISFKRVTPGPDGVISLEGTLIGMAGAALIALVYAIGFGYNSNIIIIVIAGTVGNLSDSLMGATLERRGVFGNNTVNFLNTAVGAAVCFLLAWII